MANDKNKFMKRMPHDNTEWVAQQIISNFTEKQFMELHACFEKLNEVLYKSWARDMPLAEIKRAVDIVAELSELQ